MSNLTKFIGFVFSRQMLAFVVVAVLAVAIWYLGPLLVFGYHQPLESAWIRLAMIGLLLLSLLFWYLRWPLSIVAGLFMCLLFWQVGPLFGMGDVYPLAPIGVRLALIAFIVVCLIGYGLYRLLLALRTNDALLKRVLNPPDRSSDGVARAEIRSMGLVVSKAISQLKRLRGASVGWSGWLQSGRYLYELPWYMVVGRPGAGKTSAILNSGLQFPLAEQMGAAFTRGHGGTANCDWWFTNEAVLIDTAGRYSEQDEEQNAEATAVNAAEWKGFLGLLRKYRPRAPINGVVVAVSVADLIGKSDVERRALAAMLRSRVGELRTELSIRFPVYVLLTKVDLLPGFAEYFQSLTIESRAQVWGFTLPYKDGKSVDQGDDLTARCTEEFRLLEQRLDAGLNNRIMEEYGLDKRKHMYPLPQEFHALADMVTELVGQIFLNSRYDDMQLQHMLRGVYLSSAEQTTQVMEADTATLLQRLRRRISRLSAGESGAAQQVRQDTSAVGHRSFFLRNLFLRLIVPEAYLVRPNRKWELRFLAVRWVAHLVVLALFSWMIGAFLISYGNNREYLSLVANKVETLEGKIGGVQAAQAAGLLNDARQLPQMDGLDLAAPGPGYRYGFYVAPGIVDASDATYLELLRHTLLPRIAASMQSALEWEIERRQSDRAYRTLLAYLMLYDKDRYDATVLRDWVMRSEDVAEKRILGAPAGEMAVHVGALFAPGTPVMPAKPIDNELVQRARAFLSAEPPSQRLYERSLIFMQTEAPENLTLGRMIGGQGASLFTLAEGSAFVRGMPGLYTHDGYHQVFKARLPEFLERAAEEDSWVMGHETKNQGLMGALRQVGKGKLPPTLLDDVQRQYLRDYAERWERYLGDIRLAASGRAEGEGALTLDLSTLRALAAPDSPLTRLARAAVQQTTLSVADQAKDASQLDKAIEAAARRSYNVRLARDVAAGAATQLVPPGALERGLVDDRFSALREVVTGSSGNAQAGALSGGGKPLALDALIGLINEQYSRLVVARNALSTDSLPPPLDIGTSLQVEAEKLPAPLRRVIGDIASQAANRIGQEVGALLAAQIDASVGGACRRAIGGKYPFSAAGEEVDIEDFNRLFSVGGVFDEFFKTNLAAHVDTTLRPWRYRSLSAGMPAIRGPSLEPFERAARIREVLFREQGGQRMSLKLELRVASVDPTITELLLDLDGHALRYVHGPVTPFLVTWPGPRGGSHVEISARPRIHPQTSSFSANGPWALLRLLERGRLSGTASGARTVVNFDFDGRSASLDIAGSGMAAGDIFRKFRCPGAAL